MSFGEKGKGFSSAALLIVAISNPDKPKLSDKSNRFIDWTPMSEAGTSISICPPALAGLLLSKLDGDLGFVAGFDRDGLGYFSQGFMPNFDGVIAWRHIGNLKCAAAVSRVDVGMVGDDEPAGHPRMGVATDFNNFRLVEGLGHFLSEAGLRPVHR